MPKISIIVPVYNVEKFLPRCLDSIIRQTFKDWECLVIDDGSTDTSSAICDEYARKDNRIKVFHKKNGGVSSARNLGLDYCKGEWITFCDADDEVLSDWLSIFQRNCANSDLVVQGFIASAYNITTGINYKGDIKNGLLSLAQYSIIGYVWVKLFKGDIISKHHLRFNEIFVFREDEDFVLKYLNLSSYMVCTEDRGYIYNMPILSKKYSEVDNFYCCCSMYHSIRQLLVPPFDKYSKAYLDELNNALFQSYNTKKEDRCIRLATYQQAVGQSVIHSRLNIIVILILLLVPNPKIVSWLFDLKVRWKKVIL